MALNYNEPLTDLERAAVLEAIAGAITQHLCEEHTEVLIRALAKIAGADTKVIAQRAYPSDGMLTVLDAAQRATTNEARPPYEGYLGRGDASRHE